MHRTIDTAVKDAYKQMYADNAASEKTDKSKKINEDNIPIKDEIINMDIYINKIENFRKP